MELLSLAAHDLVIGLRISALDDESSTIGRIEVTHGEPQRLAILLITIKDILQPEVLARKILLAADLPGGLQERHHIGVNPQAQAFAFLFPVNASLPGQRATVERCASIGDQFRTAVVFHATDYGCQIFQKFPLLSVNKIGRRDNFA